MKVRAKACGFYKGVYRYPGDVFELTPVKGLGGNDKNRKPLTMTAEEQFAESWMEKIGKGNPAPLKEEEEETQAPPAPSSAPGSTGDQNLI